MKNLTSINARICEIELQRKQNRNRKTHMSMIQWRFTTEGEGHTPKCQYWYYRKCDVRKAASFQVRDCHDIEQELAARGLEFKHVLKVNVHPADFMRDLYYSLIGHTLCSVQNLVCKGSTADLPLNKTALCRTWLHGQRQKYPKGLLGCGHGCDPGYFGSPGLLQLLEEIESPFY